MQEIATRIDQLEDTLCERLDKLEDMVQKLVCNTMSKGEKNAVRRQFYRQQKEARQKGRIALPEAHVLKDRDNRLLQFVPQWAEAGKKFGVANQPEKFLAWLVYQWNSCTFLKKPITFSGSSFRVWVGYSRHPYGAGDLMHYYQKRGSCPLLRSEAEYQDWQERPWWRWGSTVLMSVYEAMHPEFEQLPERFQKCVRLLLGGFGELEVYTGVYWDNCETRPNVNKMMKRVGCDYVSMLKACFTGLRAAECPVEVPS